MDNNYFRLLQEGVSGELSMLNPEQTADYFENYLAEIFIQDHMVLAILNDLLNKRDAFDCPRIPFIFKYCLDRALELRPWSTSLLELKAKFVPDSPEAAGLLNILTAYSHGDDQRLTEAEKYLSQNNKSRAQRALETLLTRHPDNATAAGLFMEILTSDLEPAGPLSSLFQCPPELKHSWIYQLFINAARRCETGKALSLWPKIPEELRTVSATILAADMFIMAGYQDQGIKLYQAAALKDPWAVPVRLRLRELQNPLRPDPDLAEQRQVVICLYSWNKAAMLEKTLASLADCHLGRARIKVLLNGCTDDSLERVTACRQLFPDNDLEIVNLPINIGAPAARNWLMNLPDCQASQYMVFMDDDIALQKDFLDYYLTVMEADPTRAVVGCKVVFPGEVPVIQYLYRTISFLNEGILKLSVANPGANTPDTGLYSYTRDTLNVMGCLHMLRTEAMRAVGGFDIRFSPSQVDDLDHDLSVSLAGYKVTYCGQVTCVHYQDSGIGQKRSGKRLGLASLGSIIGNDLKLCYKHAEHFDKLAELVMLNRRRALRQAGQ